MPSVIDVAGSDDKVIEDVIDPDLQEYKTTKPVHNLATWEGTTRRYVPSWYHLPTYLLSCHYQKGHEELEEHVAGRYAQMARHQHKKIVNLIHVARNLR